MTRWQYQEWNLTPIGRDYQQWLDYEAVASFCTFMGRQLWEADRQTARAENMDRLRKLHQELREKYGDPR